MENPATCCDATRIRARAIIQMIDFIFVLEYCFEGPSYYNGGVKLVLWLLWIGVDQDANRD